MKLSEFGNIRKREVVSESKLLNLWNPSGCYSYHHNEH